ncbi:MAG: FtsX-like permease family protein [Candidatus Aminicenantes bacterium]|nr:FtsX-like permease family protein [Candidatus Aminicenantes bacterium]
MIKFLLKGLLRDRSRSLFPVLTVSLGVLLTVFFYCYILGIAGNMLQTSAKLSSGHVRVTTRAYAEEADQLPNDLALAGINALLDGLRRDHPSLIWTPRIRFGGLLDVPDERGETKAQGPVAGIGADLLTPGSPEPGILGLEVALVRGRLAEEKTEILMSDDFARRLGLELGGTVTLISSTMYGSLATANFTLAGTLRFGAAAMDRGTMIADLSAVQDVLDMSDAAGEVLGFYRDEIYREEEADALAASFNSARSAAADPFAPVMDTLRNQSGLGEMLDLFKIMMGVFVGLFVAAMAVVLWNAGLMGNIRRYGEIGVRLAMGESKGHVYRSMIGESLLIGLAGTVVGAAVGLALAYWLQVHGLDVSGLFENASILMTTRIRARVTPAAFFIGFAPGLLATFLGSAMAGLGIYKRQTSRLMKELEA